LSEEPNFTTKLVTLLVVPNKVTLISRAPVVAPAAIVNVAEADVEFRTLTLLMAIPGPALIDIPEKKLVPDNVIVGEEPHSPLGGH
jgi:hypothetical protein